MKVLLLCLLACTAAGAAAGLLILLLKKFFRDKLSPAWHCYVWLLMMGLLLVPVLVKPELPTLALPQLPDFAQIPAETVETRLPMTDIPIPPLSSDPYMAEIPVSSSTTEDAKVESQWTMVEGTTLPSLTEHKGPQGSMPAVPSLSAPSAAAPAEDRAEIPAKAPARLQVSFPDWGWGILLLLWLGGTLYILGDQWRSYRIFTSALKSSANEPEEEALLILEEVKEALGIRRKIRLAETYLPVSPMLVGLWRPTLYLPKEKLTPRELSLIFVHELTHYRYHDLFYKELALLLRGLHWFNPLTWFMVEDIDFSCELCCDSRVRRHIGSENAKEYSALLLNLLRHEKVTAPVVSFSMDKASLKRRLSLIMKPKTTSKALSILLSLLIAFGGVACSSSVAPELEDVKDPQVSTEEKTETPAEKPVSTSKEELVYELAWVSDDNIYPLERYLAANPRAQRWIDACNAKDGRAFALSERVEENGKISYQYLIYDKELKSNSFYQYGGINLQQEPDAKGIYVNVSQGNSAEYPQAILYVRYELMEGEEPAEIPALNYSVDEHIVACSVVNVEEEKTATFQMEALLGQDEANRGWGNIHYYSDHSLEGSVNHRLYTVEEYLSVVPEAREWVEEQLSYDNDGVRALVSKSGEGSTSNYCWLIFDPSVRIGSLGATADGGNLGFDEEEDAITYSVRRNEDKNTPMALQTLTVQDLDTEETPGLTWWEGPAGERKQVVMQAEESDIDLNYQARAAIQPWAPLESGRVTTLFSEEHEALDITADMGAAITAVEEGTVTFVGFDGSNGNKVVIDHGNGWNSVYSHCDAIEVKEGDSVLQQQKIATIGISGSSTGPHLHFELRKDDVAVDPLHYFHELSYGLYNAASQEVIRLSATVQKDGQSKTWTPEDGKSDERERTGFYAVEWVLLNDFIDVVEQPKNAHYFQKTVGEDAYPQLRGEGNYARVDYRTFSWSGATKTGRAIHKDAIVFVDPTNEKDGILAWQRAEDESQWDIYVVPEHGSYARQAIALIAPELDTSVLSDLAQEYKTEINSDVVGWLMIPNLGINEPVVQAEDNETYYRMDINKKSSQDGSLWVDYECDLKGGINSQHTIIYGHNNDNRQEPIRKDGSFVKFEQLMTLCYEDVAKKVPYIHFATPEDDSVWQIFAVVEAGNEWDTWFFPEIDQSVIDYAKEHSLYDYPVSASASDKILTLSTQGPNGEDGRPSRLIVMAVQVNDAAARPSAF